MALRLSGAAARMGALSIAVTLAMPAMAQNASTPSADDIIEALSMPAAPAGLRTKGGERGLSVQVEPVEPPSMNFNVKFQLGSAALTPEARAVLDQLGAALTSESLSPYDFQISGHTDATGPEVFNLRLSEQRAQAVEDYLAAKFGIDRSRLITVGMGENALLDAGNPFSAQNRRVEIINIGAGG